MIGAERSAASLPTSVASLVGSIDEIIGPLPDSTRHMTEVIRGGSGPIARLGLALEPWPGLPAWARQARLDALFLHRHWGLDAALRAPGLPVVANHGGFDRRFGFGDNPELYAALGLHPLAGLAERDGYPLGTITAGVARSAAGLRTALEAIFGGVAEETVGGAHGEISRVAFARAMTAELVRAAAELGAHAYVTGQLRRPALAAAAGAGLHLFAVGHRRSETWALRTLAAALPQRWPGLAISVATDAAGADTGGANPKLRR